MRTYFQNIRTQLKSATASMISVIASFWIKLENPGEVNICHDSHNFRFVVKIVRFEWYMQDCLEFFSRVLRDSTSRYVGPSVRRSVSRSAITTTKSIYGRWLDLFHNSSPSKLMVYFSFFLVATLQSGGLSPLYPSDGWSVCYTFLF